MQVEITPDVQAQVDALAAVKSKLSLSDASFASSLIVSANHGRRLSDKQLAWVRKLTERAQRADVAPVAFNSDALVAFLARAGQKLKYPKVRLQAADGRPVVISVAGERSSTPGAVNITDGGPYGDNIWYGRIYQGQWKPSRNADNVIQELLQALVEDPAGVAAEYGRKTGNCCFCRRKLEDERSTEVGYGPVCAENFNLPWGEK